MRDVGCFVRIERFECWLSFDWDNFQGRLQCAALLLDRGTTADINKAKDDGSTALLAAYLANQRVVSSRVAVAERR